ncbi:MAG: IS200/IS605 family element RNA-guided endonuclease TnpB [Senegalia sp. (in: firmicutes)]|uniref:IS200/IS605 family element RNA-guided endonuclease TnpB n=1 Tax=Senegalia sp. (in: firmicutes) TaxID=1924098 RepID=UPI003F9508B6
MQRSFKYRIYPNKTQMELINKSIGCSRFVYNHFLFILEEEGYKSYSKNSKILTSFKSEKPFLKEVDKFALQNSLRALDDSFKRYFKKQNKRPHFKNKKRARKSYKTNFTNGNIEVGKNYIKLPKLKRIRAKIHRPFEGKIINATISITPTGKYYVSICVEIDKPEAMKKSNNIIGLDLGIKSYVVTSDGLVVKNPKHLSKHEERLTIEQRRLSKKKKGSNNYNKQKRKIAKIHEKITNARCDFLHKLSYKLVSENQVIIAESLKVKNMVKNKRLAKHISDASWTKFTTMIEYKAAWYERNYIKIDTFFPSSQTCSNCGYINKEVKDLNIRKWSCPKCKINHDRDQNASKNIKTEGLKKYNK